MASAAMLRTTRERAAQRRRERLARRTEGQRISEAAGKAADLHDGLENNADSQSAVSAFSAEGATAAAATSRSEEFGDESEERGPANSECVSSSSEAEEAASVESLRAGDGVRRSFLRNTNHRRAAAAAGGAAQDGGASSSSRRNGERLGCNDTAPGSRSFKTRSAAASPNGEALPSASSDGVVTPSSDNAQTNGGGGRAPNNDLAALNEASQSEARTHTL